VLGHAGHFLRCTQQVTTLAHRGVGSIERANSRLGSAWETVGPYSTVAQEQLAIPTGYTPFSISSASPFGKPREELTPKEVGVRINRVEHTGSW